MSGREKQWEEWPVRWPVLPSMWSNCECVVLRMCGSLKWKEVFPKEGSKQLYQNCQEGKIKTENGQWVWQGRGGWGLYKSCLNWVLVMSPIGADSGDQLSLALSQSFVLKGSRKSPKIFREIWRQVRTFQIMELWWYIICLWKWSINGEKQCWAKGIGRSKGHSEVSLPSGEYK